MVKALIANKTPQDRTKASREELNHRPTAGKKFFSPAINGTYLDCNYKSPNSLVYSKNVKTHYHPPQYS